VVWGRETSSRIWAFSGTGGREKEEEDEEERGEEEAEKVRERARRRGEDVEDEEDEEPRYLCSSFQTGSGLSFVDLMLSKDPSLLSWRWSVCV
jgi:hypothetical protein